MAHYSFGQVLTLCWLAATLIGWLALRWRTALGTNSASSLVSAFGARLGRGVRVSSAGCAVGCAWVGLYFAFTPFAFGGYHPNWAALALGGALIFTLIALTPRPSIAAQQPPLEGAEAWPY